MKSRLLRFALLVAAIVGLTGCASVSKQATNVFPEAQPDSGLVYFYREKKFVGAAVSYNVREQDKIIGAIANGTYFFVHATPGEHTYKASTEADILKTVDVEAGKTYYIRCGVDMGFMAGRPSLTLVAEAEAKSVIRDLTYAIKEAK